MDSNSINELVERVRAALVNYGTWRMQKPKREQALAALTELAERLEAAERERNSLQDKWYAENVRVATVERERDEWRHEAESRMEIEQNAPYLKDVDWESIPRMQENT